MRMIGTGRRVSAGIAMLIGSLLFGPLATPAERGCAGRR